MISEPKTEERALQNYVGIRMQTPRAEISNTVGPLFPELFQWLGSQGLTLAGPPIIRYWGFGDDRMDYEVGMPIAERHAGDERVKPDTLPAGRYATLTLTGSFDQLFNAHMRLGEWCGEEGLKLDQSQMGSGEKWGARIERYLSNPATEPDESKWETEVAFLLAD